jgi:hypothetical protein
MTPDPRLASRVRSLAEPRAAEPGALLAHANQDELGHTVRVTPERLDQILAKP